MLQRSAAPVLDDLLRDLLEQIADIFEVDTALILLLGRDGRALAAGNHARIPPVTAAGELDPLLRKNGITSRLAVPLLIDERFVGFVVVGALRVRAFSEDDARLLQVLADRAALAIQDDGRTEQHRRAWSLQRSLLVDRLPDVPGLALAARYVPARAAAGIGGGWYDAFRLRNGRLALAIGDVSARGERAATLMSELRHALRAYALDGDPPPVVAAKMWHFVDALQHGEMATFLYAIHDAETSTVAFCGAGHPGPLLLGPDGGVAFADARPSAPLGVGGPPRGDALEAELAPGMTMLLYTDALAERHGERLLRARERLVAAATAAPHEPEALCSQLLEALLDGRRPEDDVALLAVQAVVASEGALECTVPALPEELAMLRGRLKRWLASRGADDRAIAAITLATQEACANAVEHAYGLADDTFELAAVQVDGTVEVTVRDRGHWRAPRGEDRGRGLTLMRELVDDVEVVPGDDGTTVRLVQRLRAAT